MMKPLFAIAAAMTALPASAAPGPVACNFVVVGCTYGFASRQCHTVRHCETVARCDAKRGGLCFRSSGLGKPLDCEPTTRCEDPPRR